MKTHNIKIHPGYFDRLVRGEKPFEFRKNDRDYREGDCVIMHECTVREGTVGAREIFSGRSCTAIVKDVYDLGKLYPQFDGFVIFTFHVLKFNV